MHWSVWSLILSPFLFFSSRRRHTRFDCDWSSDVCSSDLVEKRAAPLQRGEQAAIDDGERRFECFGVGAAGERERLPSQLSQVLLIPRGFQFGGALRDEELLESRRKSTQLRNCFHTGNVERPWILRYPIRRLNLARSCAGAGRSSPRSSRLLPAPVEAAADPLSSGSRAPSRSPAACRCSMPRSWR